MLRSRLLAPRCAALQAPRAPCCFRQLASHLRLLAPHLRLLAVLSKLQPAPPQLPSAPRCSPPAREAIPPTAPMPPAGPPAPAAAQQAPEHPARSVVLSRARPAPAQPHHPTISLPALGCAADWPSAATPCRAGVASPPLAASAVNTCLHADSICTRTRTVSLSHNAITCSLSAKHCLRARVG